MSSDSTLIKEEGADYLQSFLLDIEQDDKFHDDLLKIRKSAPTVRKAIVKELVNSSQPARLVEDAVAMIHEQNIEWQEKERILKLLCRVLQQQIQLGVSSSILNCSPKLLELIKELLMSHEKPVSLYGEALIANLGQLIGLKSFLTTLKPTFEQADQINLNANCLACSARTFGLPLILTLLKALILDKSHLMCQLGLVIIQKLPVFLDQALILPFTKQLVTFCIGPLSEFSLSNFANGALLSLAAAVYPLGFEAFEPSLSTLWKGARRRKGRPMVSFLRTLAALVPLAPKEKYSEIYCPVLELAIPLFKTTDLEERRSVLNVIRRCVKYLDREKAQVLLSEIATHFWVVEVANDKQTSFSTLMTTLELPVDDSDLVKELIDKNLLISDNSSLQRLALEILGRLKMTQLTLDKRREQRLFDGIIASMPDPTIEELESSSGELIDATDLTEDSEFRSISTNVASATAFIAVLKALPSDTISTHAQYLVKILLERNASPSPNARHNAARILGGFSEILGRDLLIFVLRRLYEELGEQYPNVLAEVIEAINAIFIALDPSDFANLDPSVAQIITRISPILRNRNDKVQEACIKVIKTIAEVAGEYVPAREWMHLCFEVLELQKSQRQTTRFQATAAFASISAVVGPADVVATLIDHLRSSDRQFRVTTAAAIASVAAETGPFTALPVLCNEYCNPDTVVQHGVLKTLAFLFEFLDKSKVVPYIEPLVSLLDDALLTSNQVHRQNAAVIIYHMSQASIGEDKEALFQHFLNQLFPSIFETSPHVIDRIIEAVNEIRKVLGSPKFSMYLWSGLFFPSRKVREVYWKMWNSMYIDDADSLVSSYPLDIPDPLNNESDIRDMWI